MTHTRRAVFTGLATLPAIATASVSPQADPIFAAIDRYRRAAAAFATVDEDAEPERYAVIEDELGISGEALFATLPTTRAGAAAFAQFFIEDGGPDTEGHRALGVLSEALPQLTV